MKWARVARTNSIVPVYMFEHEKIAAWRSSCFMCKRLLSPRRQRHVCGHEQSFPANVVAPRNHTQAFHQIHQSTFTAWVILRAGCTRTTRCRLQTNRPCLSRLTVHGWTTRLAKRTTSRRRLTQLWKDGTSIHLAIEDHGGQKKCTITPLVVGSILNTTTSRSENPSLFVSRRVDQCSQQRQQTIQFLLVAVCHNMPGKRPSRRSNIRTMRKSSRPVSKQLIVDRRCTAVVKRASRRSQVRRVHSNGPSASPCSARKQSNALETVPLQSGLRAEIMLQCGPGHREKQRDNSET